jgi:hypothetical protein
MKFIICRCFAQTYDLFIKKTNFAVKDWITSSSVYKIKKIKYQNTTLKIVIVVFTWWIILRFTNVESFTSSNYKTISQICHFYT